MLNRSSGTMIKTVLVISPQRTRYYYISRSRTDWDEILTTVTSFLEPQWTDDWTPTPANVNRISKSQDGGHQPEIVISSRFKTDNIKIPVVSLAFVAKLDELSTNTWHMGGKRKCNLTVAKPEVFLKKKLIGLYCVLSSMNTRFQPRCLQLRVVQLNDNV